MNNGKVAAIWCRISDPKQMSLDSQEVAVRRALEAQGYETPPRYVLKTDWTSLDLMACPEFQQLRGWIASGEVQAVGTLDRDRLQAQGLQRLLFLSECKERGVQIITAQGVPMLDGGEGQLVELALALGKEKSVLRAQQGARDGLRDRAKLKGLPPVPKNPYGYTWDKARTCLIPNSNWPHAQFICRAGLEGWPIRRIMKELHHRGVASPTGKEWWPPNSVHWILSSPVYGGRYYALRQESVVPLRRRGETYGRSSGRVKPLSEAMALLNITVENPPLTWDEWLAVQDRLKANKLQAQRNAKRDYLLRSIVFCDAHGRRYHGEPRGGHWRYTCRGNSPPGSKRCPKPYLPGPGLEEEVKALCRKVLSSPDIIERELRQRQGTIKATEESLRKSLTTLERKEARNLDAETNLLLEKARGDASSEAYARAMARLKAERAWIVEERQRLQAQLVTARQGEALVLGLAQARERLAAKLQRASAEDWRMVFNALAVEVHVNEDGTTEVAIAIPMEEASEIVSHTPGRLAGGLGVSPRYVLPLLQQKGSKVSRHAIGMLSRR
ncbi:MAG: recombinase family protein [Chloroflexota bacterium]|nr:recombinase family protein [Chloroflexota bacterium]